jgi:uncharacterized protein (TIGR00251 family)
VTDLLPSLRQTSAGLLLDVRVVPRAARTVVGGLREGRLVIRVTAPPVDNAANEAVVRALADALDVPRQSVRIAAGAASRNKTVAIAGGGAGVLQVRLAALAGK